MAFQQIKPNIVELSDEQDWDKFVTYAPKPTVIEFYVPWAEPCDELYDAIKVLAKEMPEVEFVRYNMDRLWHKAETLKVEGVPALVLYKSKGNGQGAVIWDKSIGHLHVDVLRQKLKELVEASVVESV